MTKRRVMRKGVHKTGKVLHKAGSWLWSHSDVYGPYLCMGLAAVLMVSGANKLVFGRVFPKL